jgi:hypothetical protein
MPGRGRGSGGGDGVGLHLGLGVGALPSGVHATPQRVGFGRGLGTLDGVGPQRPADDKRKAYARALEDQVANSHALLFYL